MPSILSVTLHQCLVCSELQSPHFVSLRRIWIVITAFGVVWLWVRGRGFYWWSLWVEGLN